MTAAVVAGVIGCVVLISWTAYLVFVDMPRFEKALLKLNPYEVKK